MDNSRKVIVMTGYTPSLMQLRMDMMREFKRHGYEVIACGEESEQKWGAVFEKEHIRYVKIPIDRNGLNILKDIQTIAAMYKLMKKERADKVFLYQVKAVLYGSIAAFLSKQKDVYVMIGGLGSIFRGETFKSKVIRQLIKVQYKMALKKTSAVFFQNADDRDKFLKWKLIQPQQAVMINGSGVNLVQFANQEIPEEVSFLFVGRLIRDKGIAEYLNACKVIKEEFPLISCKLLGPFDSNPSAIQKEDLEEYIQNGIVEYLGEKSDVRCDLAKCSVFVLPSYHEGTPKAVLEAMAVGRAILTTDAPGCRETVIDGSNGYLVQPKNSEDLAEKMKILINNPEIVKEMGKQSRKIAEEKYDVNKVNKVIIKNMGM